MMRPAAEGPDPDKFNYDAPRKPRRGIGSQGQPSAKHCCSDSQNLFVAEFDRNQTNPLEIYDDVELHAKFRFRRIHILSIMDEVRDAIEYPVTRQGSLSELKLYVFIALRFFATGCFHNLAGEMIGSTSRRCLGQHIE